MTDNSSSLSLVALTPNKLKKALVNVFQAGLVPYVQSSPGIGKSDIYRSIAKEANLKIIDVRLSQCSPEDLQGLPMRSEDGKKAMFAPFSMFPIEGDPLPEGKDGWLILMDELSSATKSVQAAAYKLILDREVGVHKLHSNVVIGAAGNKLSDRAVVVAQSTALQSRLVHFDLVVSKDDWIDWAINNNIDSRIIGYIQYKPSALHDFKPDHQDRTFPCPRTWNFVSKLIQGKSELDSVDLACIAGAISQGPAIEFQKFAEIAGKVPSIRKIQEEPETTEIPREPSFRYFIVASLMDHTNGKNFSNVMKYVGRMPEEFQVIFLRSVIKRDKTILSSPDYAQYATKILRFISSDEEDEYGAK